MKTTSRLLTGACILLVSVSGARAQARDDAAMVALIRAEGLERSQAPALFNTLTNVIGPRLTASPAFKRAVDWTRDQLEGFGLADVHLEAWPFGRGWSLERLTLELAAPRYFPLIGYAEAWTPSTHGVVEGEPVYVGDRTLEQVRAMRDRLRGAIVLLQPPQTEFIQADRPQPTASDAPVRIGAPPMLRNQGPVSARALLPVLQEAGAAVLLRPNQGEHGTLFVLGRANTADDAIPSVILASEHYDMLVHLLQAGEAVRLRVDVGTRYHTQDTSAYNVLAEIPGTDPALKDQVVMLGAHLDSWHSATGATDNADGVASAMEAMRILLAVGAKPRRTIRLALWGGEEEGLLGSREYVRRHLAGDANRDAREHLVLYLNDDPGAGPTYGFYMEGNDAARQIFDGWLSPLKDLGARRNVPESIGSTDHVSFRPLGVPAFNTIKDYVDYDTRTHHTNMDFFERVSAADLRQSAIVMATFAYRAAMRDEPIPRMEAPARPTGR